MEKAKFRHYTLTRRKAGPGKHTSSLSVRTSSRYVLEDGEACVLCLTTSVGTRMRQATCGHTGTSANHEPHSTGAYSGRENTKNSKGELICVPLH